ncbi:MAG: lipopolysaccharide biosynthesis protein, partial [Raoultibacter sp.]
EPFRELAFIMLAAGGVTAAIDFLYQVITVLRQQKSVTKLYLISFGFSLFIPILLVNFTGLPGIVIGYLIVMSILFVLLVWEYLRIRRTFANTPGTPNAPGTKRRPSELRAERQRLAQHRGDGMSKHSDHRKPPFEL